MKMTAEASSQGSSHDISEAMPIHLINHEDDSSSFFSRLLSKESSLGNPSFGVYYGGAGGAVPFLWESEPGTPRHGVFREGLGLPSLPPLAPPPSSFRMSSDNKWQRPRKARSSGFMHRLLRKLGCSSRPLPAGSLAPSSLRGFMHTNPVDYRRGRSRFSSQGSFDWIDPDDDGKVGHISALCPGSCFGTRKGPRGFIGW
ncbi:hypothetical protein SAY87_023875 [Trapa incisa]|uniref:Uncharacterized protein n=1 Tax=Trapa incisa TaxID=236973 RepID=A0AAN7L1C8_9MYRT|nr:hypothetical protein SAY87_023875 [Trapa incisa]